MLQLFILLLASASFVTASTPPPSSAFNHILVSYTPLIEGEDDSDTTDTEQPLFEKGKRYVPTTLPETLLERERPERKRAVTAAPPLLTTPQTRLRPHSAPLFRVSEVNSRITPILTEFIILKTAIKCSGVQNLSREEQRVLKDDFLQKTLSIPDVDATIDTLIVALTHLKRITSVEGNSGDEPGLAALEQSTPGRPTPSPTRSCLRSHADATLHLNDSGMEMTPSPREASSRRKFHISFSPDVTSSSPKPHESDQASAAGTGTFGLLFDAAPESAV